MDPRDREALRAWLADPTVPKSELELHRIRRHLERARASDSIAEADYHDLVGVVAALLGDLDAAVSHCRLAMEREVTIARQYDLGAVLYQAGRFTEARAVLDDLARRHRSVALRAARASCALALGDRRAARELLDQALEKVGLDRPGDMVRLIPVLSAARMDREALVLFAAVLCAVHGVADPEVETDPLSVIARAPVDVLERAASFSPIDLEPLFRARRPPSDEA